MPSSSRVCLRSNWRASAADFLAGGTLITIPWSTSATSLLILMWLLVVIPSLDWDEVRDQFCKPAAYLPLLLWALACLGLFWADAPWADRLAGFRSFFKLLLIPLLMLHFRRSEYGWKVLAAFVISSLALATYSWASLLWPGLIWGDRVPGVPIKDYIYQSLCFAICACILLHLAITEIQAARYLRSTTFLAAAVTLLANIAYVGNSRTTLIVLGVLLPVIGYQRFRWRGAVALLLLASVFGVGVWSTSSFFRNRVSALIDGTIHYSPAENTSESERIEFWRKSWALIQQSPILGYGTGSIRKEFERLQGGTHGAAAVVVANPHNQSFAVGLQLGAGGIIILWLMWLSHLRLFTSNGMIPWVGTIIVVQNVVSSAFNSHLSDFTAGWLYVLGVGILGGMTARPSARCGQLSKG